jgi:hypothetical protein
VVGGSAYCEEVREEALCRLEEALIARLLVEELCAFFLALPWPDFSEKLIVLQQTRFDIQSALTSTEQEPSLQA